MALIDCKFFSDTLGMSCSMLVIVPQAAQRQIGMRAAAAGKAYRTLWLLHGDSDDETTWMRRTSIERYVAPLGLAVVMPNVHRSYYTNMLHGHRYWDFVSEELPQLARSFFRLSERREDNFVAGLSMGGYGALKLGLTHPERFAAVASLSGVCDLAGLLDEVRESQPERRSDYENVFGDLAAVRGSQHDLFRLASDLAASSRPRPLLYQGCGTEDWLHASNVRWRDHLRSVGLEPTYREGPGEHDWAYWDASIQDVLAWLPLG